MRALVTRRAVLQAGAACLVLPSVHASAAEPCLERLLARRRMVRRFRSDPVPDATVRRLIAAAVRAPSAGHTQPWEFVVVRERATREALARAAVGQAFVAEAPVVLVACSDVARSRARYRARGERYATIDGAFAALCLLLAVTEEGLGACFVGAFDDAEVARLVGLPAHVQPLAVIPVGHPAETPPALRLRRPRDVTHAERWQGR